MQRSNAEEQFIENFSLSPSSLSLEQGSSSVTSTQTKQLNPLTFDKTREERIVNTTTVTLKLLFHEYAMWCIAIVRIALTAEILQAIFLVFIFSILFYFPSMIYKWFYVQSNLFPVPPSPPKSYLLAAILHQKQKHFSLKPPIITLWNLWALWGENRKKTLPAHSLSSSMLLGHTPFIFHPEFRILVIRKKHPKTSYSVGLRFATSGLA